MNLLDTLKNQAAALHAEARALLTKAISENRNLNPIEERQFSELTSNLEAVHSRIEEIQNGAHRDGKVADELRRLGLNPAGGAAGADTEVLDSLRSMLIENNPRPVELVDAAPRAMRQPGVERRTLATSSPANFQPISFYGQIVESMVDSSAVLAAGATVLTTSNGEIIRVPKASGMSSAAITTEGSTIASSDPTLGVVPLGAYKYAVMVYANRELIDDSGVDLQAYLARETGTALGLALGNHLLNGTGTGQPTGALAGATAGVTGPTGTATSFGSQATAGQGTDLLNALFASVAEPYTRQPAAGFLLRNATLAAIRNLKTSTGDLVGSQYLAAAPAPFYPDAYMPAMAASAKSVLFGDWSRYFVRIVNGVRFERSDDLKFDTDQVAFRAIIRADGALIDASALKYFAHSAT